MDNFDKILAKAANKVQISCICKKRGNMSGDLVWIEFAVSQDRSILDVPPLIRVLPWCIQKTLHSGGHKLLIDSIPAGIDGEDVGRYIAQGLRDQEKEVTFLTWVAPSRFIPIPIDGEELVEVEEVSDEGESTVEEIA